MPRDGTKTRQRILDAAQAEVLERGFAATSVDAIQEAAGISRGTFFYHFATKDDLARSLIERYAEQDRAMTDELVARAEKLVSDPLQRVLVFIGLHEELFQEVAPEEAGCLFASYSYEAGLFDEETHKVILDSIDYFRSVLGGMLEEAMAVHPPRITDVEPYVLADLAYVVLQGAFILRRSRSDEGLMAEHLRQYKRYLELLFGVADTDFEPVAASGASEDDGAP
jgi:TetR/AcrR family transcriptional repressor of nem operon